MRDIAQTHMRYGYGAFMFCCAGMAGRMGRSWCWATREQLPLAAATRARDRDLEFALIATQPPWRSTSSADQLVDSRSVRALTIINMFRSKH